MAKKKVTQNVPESEVITLRVTKLGAKYILEGLSEFPVKQVGALITELEGQIMEQLNKKPEPGLPAKELKKLDAAKGGAVAPAKSKVVKKALSKKK